MNSSGRDLGDAGGQIFTESTSSGIKRGLLNPGCSPAHPAKRPLTTTSMNLKNKQLLSDPSLLQSSSLFPTQSLSLKSKYDLIPLTNSLLRSGTLTGGLSTRSSLISSVRAQKQHLTNSLLSSPRKHLLSGSSSISSSTLSGRKPLLSSNYGTGTRLSGTAGLSYKFSTSSKKPTLASNVKEETTQISTTEQEEKENLPDYGDIFKQGSQETPHQIDLSQKSDLAKLRDGFEKAQCALRTKKDCLVSLASTALLHNPDLEDPEDGTRISLLKSADEVAEKEGEFILKLALYCRQELNIRTTANFLLAYASLKDPCKPYLQRYFKNSVRLPSDWMQVADMVCSFGVLDAGSLPAVLRRAMVEKFVDFDAYQLAKHKKVKNSEIKFPNEAQIQNTTKDAAFHDVEFPDLSAFANPQPILDWSEPLESDELRMKAVVKNRRKRFNLKRLIRLLHIREPTFHVMGILGKRYPNNREDFLASRLPEMFDQSQAGKRMKLPTPETWETQIAKHGNKAAIWESLIDNKKLPYMATIRNLRNLILTGIDDVHVQKVAKYISNEKAVIGSRMFPFQFYTAFDVLRDLDVFKDKTINQSDLLNTKGIKTKPKGVKTFSEAALKKKIYHKLVKRKETMNSGSIKVFQDALEKAVAIASNNNIPPIKGSTLILFAFGTELGEDAKIRPVQKHLTPSQMCCLTAVMLEHTCEDCEMVAFGHKEQEMAPIVQDMGLLSSAKFLANSRISRLATSTSVLSFDSGALDDYRRNEKWIDNLVVIHGPLAQSNLEDGMTSWLAKYRHGVNPDLVYANINLDGSKAPPQSRNANDIFLVGFSEQIFHALSNSSRGGQLERIESIDRRFKLAPLKKPLIDVPAPEMQLTGSPKKWRQIRVFVSSTFTDMHGERDLINRFVMPELQRRAKSLHMDVRAIDLRWGILPYGEKHDTNEDNVFSSSLWRGGNFRGEANGTTQVMACLREIEKCHLFIGLLGDRYGWKPPLTASSFLSENELSMKLEALKGEMGRASITELEMEYAALHNPEESRDRAFFFLRDSSLLNAQLPPDYAQLFKCQDEEDERRLQSLKQRIISSGLEVFNGYPAHLDGGENQGKPITVGLEALGQRILDSLWNSLLNLDEKAKRENEQSNHTSHSEFRDHEEYSSYIASHKCVSRSKIVDNIHESLGRLSGGIVELTGNPGSGLSTLMCQSFNEMKKRLTLSASQKGVDGPPLLVPFFSASSQNGTGSMQTFLKYLVQSLSEIVDGRGPGASTKFQDHELQQLDAKSLGVKAASLLNTVSEVMTSRGRSGKKQKLVLFVDGLEDYMEQAKVYWLPPQISNGVILVVSSHFGSKWNKHLQDRKEKDHRTIRVGPLTLLEKKALVRHSLAQRGKKLDETAFNNELNLLVSKRDASNPAYLSLLTNEMAGFGVFEDLQSKLSMAGNTMSELLSQILERLEIDLNEELVANAMCCLALSAKLGLTENELHSALALLNTSPFSKRDVTVAELSQILSEGQFKPIPPLQLSILINGLESFLQPTQGSLIEGLLLLKKGEWLKSVTERYFSKGCHSAQNIHLVLAGVFHHIYRFAPNHPRALQGLPEHLASTGNVKLLEQTICSLDYIRECAAFPDILQELALRHFNGHYLSGRPQLERFLASEQIKAYSAFVHLHWTSLIDQPSLAYQLALTEPQSTPPHKEAVAKTMNNGYDAKQITTCSSSAPLWLFWENRSEGECLGENNEGTNNLLAVKACKSSRMAVICLEKSSLISPEELLVACGHDDGHIIVGLAHNNEELFSLVGHSSPISSLTFLPGTSSSETCLVSGSQDGMISFWDLNSQIRTNSVQGHSRCVSGLACSSDGLTLVSVGWDGRIKIWSGRSQREMSCIQQSTQAFNCVAFHPDKDYIIAGGWDGLLKIYDLTTLERKAIVRGHLTSIQCVAISSDGKKIVSGSSDGVVKVFDSGIGGECGSFRVGHCVHSIALDNSRINTEGVPRILIGTRDGVIHFWTTDEGTEHPSIVLDLESDLDLDVETVIDAPTDFEITCNGSDMETDEIGPQTGLRITSFCILPCLFGVTDTNMALGCADGTLLIVKISSVSKTVIMRSKIANGPIIGTLPITWENLWTNSTFDECHFCLVSSSEGVYLACAKKQTLEGSRLPLGESEVQVVGARIFSYGSSDYDIAIVLGTAAGFCLLLKVQNPTLTKINRLFKEAICFGNEELLDFKVCKKTEASSTEFHFLTLTSLNVLSLWLGTKSGIVLLTSLTDYSLGSKLFIPNFGQKEFVFVTNQMGKFESYLISGKTKALDQEEDQISSSEFKFVHKGIFESRKAGSITGFLQASESDCYFGCIHENQDITIWSKKGIEIKWINMERQGHSLVSLSRQSVGGSCLKDEDPSTWYLGIFNPKKMRGQFQMFDIFNAKLTESYIGHNGPVTALNMAHDRVFSASRDGTLRIWDAGKRGTRLNGSPVVGLVACNGLILTVCRDGSLVSHEVEGGHSRVLGSFFNGQGHTEHIRYASLVSLQEAIVIIVATNHRALRVALLEGEENHLTFPYHKYFSDRELLFFGAKQSDPQTCILTVLFDKPRISGTGAAYAPLGYANAYGYGYNGLQAYPNGAIVPVDEPAVQAAKAEHFAAKGLAYAAPVYAHGPAAYYGPALTVHA
ncbi:telomerase protein component 1-like, partial [Tigriopus californicus]|uniref:telomerase protein component 1-like n=1 Tax=Tigriopus californicus TaxID=6832 RepID=UPI0027DAA139